MPPTINQSRKENNMANIIRRDPLGETIDDLFRGFFVRPVNYAAADGAPRITVDVAERDASYVVTAEIPGARKEDIQIRVDGPLVSISAERSGAKETREGERVLLSERYFGKVARSIELSQEIDETRAEARYNDGVLELTLPKKAQVSARQISIQ
jgi:HSP20 family protein